MKPYRTFNDWMHTVRSLEKKARDPNQDLILLIIVILFDMFLFAIEWRFKKSMEDYQEE